MKSAKATRGFWTAGILTAMAASLCCITPVLALIAGVSGAAAAFSWMEPFRPYLIGITVLVLGFAWYRKLKPRKKGEIACDCEENEKSSFLQSKTFLAVVTVFAGLTLAFPNYAEKFYPANEKTEIVVVSSSDLQTVLFTIKGMTCTGCAAHVENEVNKLAGIVLVEASYEAGSARVAFDQLKVSTGEIQETINNTGYQVVKLQKADHEGQK